MACRSLIGFLLVISNPAHDIGPLWDGAAGSWLVFVSAVRRQNASDCEARCEPDSSVPCLVELVRAAATKGVDDTMSTRSEPGEGRLDPGLSALMSERHQLINLAYRMLGSLAEAEDVVQETYARWYAMSGQQREAIESPGGWLTTVASRICLDLLGSARARRERYVGEWIPEPLPDRTEWISGRSGGTPVDPADRVTLDESVNMAFLVVLESMTPAERVAFILHDVFRYTFAEVAEIVGRTPGACRQLASSARRRIRASQAPAISTAQRAAIVRNFKQAWEAGDINALIGLLDPDATAIGDGGGLVGAGLRPVEGGEQIARYLVDLAGRAPSNVTFLERTVNGQPGLVAQQDGVTVVVYAFDVAGDRITHIWAVLNPDKLRPWTTG
jgi:RNA polymerase sigma-70 factor (ECF subfamily)